MAEYRLMEQAAQSAPDKQNGEQAFDWTDPSSYAFQGELEFELGLEFLGSRHTKKCRVVYAFTPGEWPYYDLNTKSVQEGIESCNYRVEIQAVPELRQYPDLTWRLGKPYWIPFEDFTRDDILSHDMQDEIVNAIEDKCQAEDAERRKFADV